MKTYRIVVKAQRGQELISQGTAWLLLPDVAVTSFHVVGTREMSAWFHQQPGLEEIDYLLIVDGQPLTLTPLSFDKVSDVALLRLSRAVSEADVLRLAEDQLAAHAQWQGIAFPEFHKGQPFAISGRVASVHAPSHESSLLLQLTLEQGDQVDWSGVSGCPVCSEGKVYGVVLRTTDGAATAWAASAEAITRLAVAIGLTTMSHQISNIAVDAFREYYLGSEEAPKPVGGRRDEVAFLNGWLASDRSPRYLLLLGPAGRGKSALLTHWARIVSQRPEWTVIFYPVSIRFNTNLASVVYSTLAAQLAALHRRFLSSNELKDVESLRSKITEFIKTPLPDGKRLLLIIDGIDEAADWVMKADMFPPLLASGNNLRIILSARQKANDSEGAAFLHELGWISPDVARVTKLQPLGIEGVSDIVKGMASDKWSPDLLDRISLRLYSLSQGDPLVVRLWLDALLQETNSGYSINEDRLDQAPPGIDGWFADWWKQHRKLTNVGSEVNDDITRNILAFLSCAFGPLTLDDLRALILLSPVHAVHSGAVLRNAIQGFDRLIIGGYRDQGYVFAHPQLGLYYREQHLTEAEQRDYGDAFIKYCRNSLEAARGGAQAVGTHQRIPVYVIRNYGAHLAQRGACSLDYGLILTGQWADAWKTVSGTYAGFLMDVGRAWSVLQEEHRSDARQKKPLGRLAAEICCLLFNSGVGSIAANIPPGLLISLVHYRMWTSRQALDYIAQIPEPTTQSYGLIRMIRIISTNDHDCFLDITSRLPDMQMGHVLQESAAYLTEPVLRKALMLANREREFRGRARATGKILARYSADDPQQFPLLMQLISEIQRYPDIWQQGQLFSFLYDCFDTEHPLRGTLAQYAIAKALEIDDSYIRGDIISELFESIPLGHPNLAMLVDVVLRAAREDSNEWQAIELLTKAMKILQECDPRWPLISVEILDRIEKLEHVEQQTRSLISLFMSVATETSLSQEIENRIFRKLENDTKAIDETVKMLHRVTNPQRLERLVKSIDGLQQKCTDLRNRIRVLVTLVTLPINQPKQQQYFEQAFDALLNLTNDVPRFVWITCLDMVSSVSPAEYIDRILALTTSIGDDVAVAKCIMAFDPVMSLGEDKLCRHFDGSSDLRDRVLALAEFVPFVSQVAHSQNFSKVFQLAKELPNSDQRGYALSHLVTLAGDCRSREVLMEALDNIAGITFDPSRWHCISEVVKYSDVLLIYDESLLLRLIPLDLLHDDLRLLGPSMVAEWAQNLLGAIMRTDLNLMKRLLVHLFEKLKAISRIESRLIACCQILRTREKAPIEEIASELSTLINDDLRIIEDRGIRAQAYASLAPVLQNDSMCEAIDSIFSNWHQVPHLGDHREPLMSLLKQICPNLRVTAIEIIQGKVAREPDLDWRGLAAILTPYDAGASADMLETALDDIQDISEPARYQILAAIGPRLDGDLFDYAFAIALHARDDSMPQAIDSLVFSILQMPDLKIYDYFLKVLNKLATSKREVTLKTLPVLRPIIERLGANGVGISVASVVFDQALWKR